MTHEPEGANRAVRKGDLNLVLSGLRSPEEKPVDGGATDPESLLKELSLPEDVLAELKQRGSLCIQDGLVVLQGELASTVARQVQAAFCEAVSPSQQLRPRWDCERRELWLGDRLVKRVAQHAYEQLAVLNALEQSGWPEELRNPLEGEPGEVRRKLIQVLRWLSRGQREPLLEFRVVPRKNRLTWRIRTGR